MMISKLIGRNMLKTCCNRMRTYQIFLGERLRHWQKNWGLLEIPWDTMVMLEVTTLLMTLLMMITEIHMSLT
eukprot:3419817-Ditylum_brightwellii.AAC.1